MICRSVKCDNLLIINRFLHAAASGLVSVATEEKVRSANDTYTNKRFPTLLVVTAVLNVGRKIGKEGHCVMNGFL